jgi:hypothetical protein
MVYFLKHFPKSPKTGTVLQEIELLCPVAATGHIRHPMDVRGL